MVIVINDVQDGMSVTTTSSTASQPDCLGENLDPTSPVEVITGDNAEPRVLTAKRSPTAADLRPTLAVPPAPLAAGCLIGVASDQLTEVDVARLRALAPKARIVNLYGPTEISPDAGEINRGRG